MPEDTSNLLTVAHIATETSCMHLALKKIKEIVEQESDPPLKVKIFPNGQQGGEVEMVEKARQNTVQAVLISTAVMSNYAPALTAVTLPYLFKDVPSVKSFMTSGVSRTILKSLEGASLIGLGYCYNNFFNLFIGRRSSLTGIHILRDISGQPFRAGQSAIWADMIDALGFKAVSVPFPGLEAGLTTGEVDGCDGIISIMDDLGYERLIKSITLSKHWVGLPVFSIYEDFFRALSSKNQNIIKKAADNIFEDFLDKAVADQENERAINSFEKKGVEVVRLDTDVIDSFAKATRVVHEKYENVIGKELLHDLYKICGYTIH